MLRRRRADPSGTGLKSVGLDWKEELRRAMEEQVFEAQQVQERSKLQLMMGGQVSQPTDRPCGSRGPQGYQGYQGPQDSPQGQVTARRSSATYQRPGRIG
jgi:hypothetical protein